MNPQQQPRPANFDRIARAYRWLEYLSLGPVLEHLRLHHLPQLLHADKRSGRALILGDGDGRFTARLLSADLEVEADAVDLSPVMLALLERRCLAASPDARERLRLHHRDALEFTANSLAASGYDLVVTHFFLDCLPQAEVEQLVRNVMPLLTTDALWLVSEFRIPGGILHWPARLYIRMLYLAFRLLTGLRTTRLPDHAAALHHAGLRNIATCHMLFGLLTTELWQRPSQSQATCVPATVSK